MAFLTREQITATAHLSSREAARVLGTGKTSVNKYRKHYGVKMADGQVELPQANVLILDIESKPMQAYVWGKKADWIPDNMLIDSGGMMCFAAKWLGKPDVEFWSEFHHGRDEMVKAAHSLLNRADIVITYNGDRYDIKRLNNEFLLAGMAPPSPYRSIDLYKTNRKQFDLPSKKLDYIVQATGLGAKEQTGGFQLWIDCMNGDYEAWEIMEKYNVGDVYVTESLYIRLLPWLANVPHMGMFTAEQGDCPYCGAKDSLEESDNTTRTPVQEYRLYKCLNCEGWSRGTKPIQTPLTTRKVA